MKAFAKRLVFAIVQFIVVIFIAAGLSDCGDHGAGHDGHGGHDGDAEHVATTASGGDTEATASSAASTAAPTGGAATAAIKGKVMYEGKPLKRIKIPMQADPLCVLVNEGKDVLTESYVVGEDGSLENVFVFIKDISGKFPPPAAPVVLDQRGCTYRPHVLGMIAGQGFEIRNSDKSNHNINVMAKVNRGFNVNQGPGQAPMLRKDLRRVEQPIKVKCNVHPWMNASIFVMSHPYFAVAGKGGTFEIPEKLSPGTYTVVAWQEKLGEMTQQVTVGDGETREITFTFTK